MGFTRNVISDRKSEANSSHVLLLNNLEELLFWQRVRMTMRIINRYDKLAL